VPNVGASFELRTRAVKDVRASLPAFCHALALGIRQLKIK
jgi:hypothetical protein